MCGISRGKGHTVWWDVTLMVEMRCLIIFFKILYIRRVFWFLIHHIVLQRNEEDEEEQIYQYVTCHLGIIDGAMILRRPPVWQWQIELEVVDLITDRSKKTRAELWMIQMWFFRMIWEHHMIRPYLRTQLHCWNLERLMSKVWPPKAHLKALLSSRAFPTTLSLLTTGW